MSSVEILGEKVSEGDDPYRENISGESEKNTVWRHGAPPQYTLVNNLFQRTRTKDCDKGIGSIYHSLMFKQRPSETQSFLCGKLPLALDWISVWPKGSLEETVQNLVKTWEMELSHKTQIHDFKTIDPHNFSLSVNGRPALSGKETLEMGSYNALLQTSLPEELQYYKRSKETFESSHEIFQTAFPGGFAWEVVEVYTGPPVVNFKFRHWGIMEGPFKGHAPSRETVQFTGIAIAKVDEKLRMEKVEVYYDPAELCGGLLKGPFDQNYGEYKIGIEGCPFLA